MQQQLPLNYLSDTNNVHVTDCSSELPVATAANVINAKRSSIWMSEEGMPQYICFDISKMTSRPKFFKSIAFDCWHDYKTNPATIQLLVTSDPTKDYITWSTLYLELKEGVQTFSIDPLGVRYGYIKILIKETFGAAKTYLNTVSLFEEGAPANSHASAHSNVNSLPRKKQSGSSSDLSMHIDPDSDTHKLQNGSVAKTKKKNMTGVQTVMTQFNTQTNHTLQDLSPAMSANFLTQHSPMSVYNQIAPTTSIHVKPLQMSPFAHKLSQQNSPSDEHSSSVMQQQQFTSFPNSQRNNPSTLGGQQHEQQQQQLESMQKQLFNLPNNRNSISKQKQHQIEHSQPEDSIDARTFPSRNDLISMVEQDRAELIELKRIVNALLEERIEKDERIKQLEGLCKQLQFGYQNLFERVEVLENSNKVIVEQPLLPQGISVSSVVQRKISTDHMRNIGNGSASFHTSQQQQQQQQQFQLQQQQQQLQQQEDAEILKTNQKRHSMQQNSPQTFGKNFRQQNARGGWISGADSPSVNNYSSNNNLNESLRSSSGNPMESAGLTQEKIAQIIDQRLQKFSKAIVTGIIRNPEQPPNEKHHIDYEDADEVVVQESIDLPRKIESSRAERNTQRYADNDTDHSKKNHQKSRASPAPSNIAPNNNHKRTADVRTVREQQQQQVEDVDDQVLYHLPKQISAVTANAGGVKKSNSKSALLSTSQIVDGQKRDQSRGQKVNMNSTWSKQEEVLDTHEQKHEQGSGNPRVMKLLERLNEKLTIRQKKVDELNSGNKLRRNNSLNRMN